MRSFARLLLIALLLLPASWAGAQPRAKSLYTGALASEAKLRAEIDAREQDTAPASLLRRVRTLVTAYERMSREYPASGYMDNALWQGALLAADLYYRFDVARDRATALRMLTYLRERFPTSSLLAKSPPHVEKLERPTVRAAAPRPAPSPPAVATPPPVLLHSIRRDVLPEAFRVTLELGREVPFHTETLEGPPRVFIDLDGTAAVDAIKDAAIAFDDGDVVERVRVGRQAGGRTRVVMDLASAARHSVYTLYNPYRVVIDFDRSGAAPVPLALTIDPAPTPAAETVTTSAPPEPPSANVSGGFSLSRQLGLGVSRIVIDPGHGGHDPGAKASGLTEASLVLDVALRLETLLQQLPGVEVILTRRVDAFVPLEERTAIANREGADLFLSIHANASRRIAARGIETYFLNLTTDPEAESVAARENAASARTMRQLPDIVKTIALNNKIDESRDFAAMIQSALYTQLKRADATVKNLGVKQAPFMVLLGATMPSVLAEVSFITNRQDQALLKTGAHRQRIAEALYAGILEYQLALKKAPVMASAR
jgi:N-acetylmuramoyl-L-alanine amidase